MRFFTIKPRRTLDSVVCELITGLESGKVIIEQALPKREFHHTEGSPVEGLSPSVDLYHPRLAFELKRERSSKGSTLRGNWLESERKAFSLLYKELLAQSMQPATFRLTELASLDTQLAAHDRVWLVVTQLGAAQLTIFSYIAKSAPRDDLRILLAGDASQAPATMEKWGLQRYVRTAEEDVPRVAMLAMLAVAGNMVFWQFSSEDRLREPTREHSLPKEISGLRFVKDAPLVENVESVFEILWESAKRR